MKMQKVSIWAGNFENEKIIEEYFDVSYSEDGDRIRSIFESKFGIQRYDDDFFEKYFAGEQKYICQILEGHSYDNQIIPKILECSKNVDEYKCNTSVLLYDFEYKGNIVFDEGDGYNMKYIGCVSYNI